MNPLNPFYLLLVAAAIISAYYAHRSYVERKKCNCIANQMI